MTMIVTSDLEIYQQELAHLVQLIAFRWAYHFERA